MKGIKQRGDMTEFTFTECSTCDLKGPGVEVRALHWGHGSGPWKSGWMVNRASHLENMFSKYAKQHPTIFFLFKPPVLVLVDKTLDVVPRHPHPLQTKLFILPIARSASCPWLTAESLPSNCWRELPCSKIDPLPEVGTHLINWSYRGIRNPPLASIRDITEEPFQL